jgi:hypothetical protein
MALSPHQFKHKTEKPSLTGALEKNYFYYKYILEFFFNQITDKI